MEAMAEKRPVRTVADFAAAGKTVNGQPDVWDRKWRQMRGTMNQCLYFRDEEQPSIYQRLLRAYTSLLWNRCQDCTTFLEVGAGRGTVSQYLHERGKKVSLLDLSANGFRLARDNWDRHGMPYPEFLVADVENSGLDPRWEVVHSVGLLEHFDDPTLVLAECDRLSTRFNHHIIVNDAEGRSSEVHRVNRTCQEWEAMVPGSTCRNTVITGVMELWWEK